MNSEKAFSPPYLVVFLVLMLVVTPVSAGVTDNLNTALTKLITDVKTLLQQDKATDDETNKAVKQLQADQQTILGAVQASNQILAGVTGDIAATKAAIDVLAEKGGLTINNSGTVRKTINGSASFRVGGWGGTSSTSHPFSESQTINTTISGITDASKCRVYVNGSLGGCQVTPVCNTPADNQSGLTGNVSGHMTSNTNLQMTFNASCVIAGHGYCPTLSTTVSYTIEEYW